MTSAGANDSGANGEDSSEGPGPTRTAGSRYRTSPGLDPLIGVSRGQWAGSRDEALRWQLLGNVERVVYKGQKLLMSRPGDEGLRMMMFAPNTRPPRPSSQKKTLGRL
uniref:Uncharacterized protein n=1 Tax=Knipowitschia caucasica TaxID=637954 RepID=A0AAV2JM62_KNICA